MPSETEQLQRVADALRWRGRLLAAKVAIRLLVGLPLTLLGPATIATAFWLAAWRFNVGLPWLPMFGVATILVVPILIWTELRSDGRYLSSTLAETGPPASMWTRMPGAHAAVLGMAAIPVLLNPRAFSAGIVEVFLTGPRLVVEAWDAVHRRRRAGAIDVERAARIVCQLMAREDGLEPSQLAEPREAAADILPPLGWLAFHGWIALGEHVDRVYLYSESRRALARAAAR